MKRTKLLATLCTLILTIACLTFGVYSAIKTTFTASGTITFNAYGIDCDLDITITGLSSDVSGVTQDSTTKLYSKTLYASTTGTRGGNYTTVVNSTTSLSLGDLKFDELNTDLTDEQRSTITISIRLYNYSKYDVQLSVTNEATIAGLTATYGAKIGALESDGTTPVQSTSDYTITLKAGDTAISGITFAPEITIQPYQGQMMQLTKRLVETGKYEYYYRVEFGQVDTSKFTVYDLDSAGVAQNISNTGVVPLYWRYLGDESRHATADEPSEAQLPLTYGYYTLDTYVENFMYFDNKTGSHNYTTSGLRNYLDGNASGYKGATLWEHSTGTSTAVNEFFTDYGLSEYFNLDTTNGGITSAKDTSEIAKTIKKSTIDSVQSAYDNSSSKYKTDDTIIEAYFYPLSYNEYAKYLQLSDKGSYSNVSNTADWVENYSSDSFWLRSLREGTYDYGANYVNNDGYNSGYSVPYACGLRPAFQIG